MLGDALAGATLPEVPDTLNRYAHRRLSTATSVQTGSTRASEDHHRWPAAPQVHGFLRLPHEWKTA
ncbi:hypothetical protein [Streptomyces mirabilis]|uniref:hypothetical protein n=1 Tax=Streptomyces mirabilis TaxID=68239 RepID=UPI0036B7D4FD